MTLLACHSFLSSLLAALEKTGVSIQILVNDRADIAASLGIGVHLPEEGLPTKAARRMVGSTALVGRSIHSLDAAFYARDEGADYVIFGPVFDTPSKRVYGPPQGVEALRVVARGLGSFPVLAIGGITPERAGACIEAGAYGLAAIGALWDSGDPVAAYRRFAESIAAGLTF